MISHDASFGDFIPYHLQEFPWTSLENWDSTLLIQLRLLFHIDSKLLLPINPLAYLLYVDPTIAELLRLTNYRYDKFPLFSKKVLT